MLFGLMAVFAGITSARMILFQRTVPDITWRPKSGYLVRLQSRNVVACCTACSRHTNCNSIFFTPVDGDCQLHRTTIDVSTYSDWKEVTSSSAEYWISNVTSSNAVDSNTSEWTLAQVSSNDTFYFRVFSMNNYTQAEAETVCGSQGSHLARMKTLERLQFYKNTIMTSNSTAGLTYWIEGKNTYSGDWIWRLSIGTPIPLPQEQSGIWGPHRPNNGNTPLCLRMRADMGYLLDDEFCTTLHPTICERDS